MSKSTISALGCFLAFLVVLGIFLIIETIDDNTGPLLLFNYLLAPLILAIGGVLFMRVKGYPWFLAIAGMFVHASFQAMRQLDSLIPLQVFLAAIAGFGYLFLFLLPKRSFFGAYADVEPHHQQNLGSELTDDTTAAKPVGPKSEEWARCPRCSLFQVADVRCKRCGWLMNAPFVQKKRATEAASLFSTTALIQILITAISTAGITFVYSNHLKPSPQTHRSVIVSIPPSPTPAPFTYRDPRDAFTIQFSPAWSLAQNQDDTIALLGNSLVLHQAETQSSPDISCIIGKESLNAPVTPSLPREELEKLGKLMLDTFVAYGPQSRFTIETESFPETAGWPAYSVSGWVTEYDIELHQNIQSYQLHYFVFHQFDAIHLNFTNPLRTIFTEQQFEIIGQVLKNLIIPEIQEE